ncbi:dihydropteroate synthase [Rhodobacteraceae bacterium M382]|nr:dihydropteroate synthase [Rhodobacteraceae bacterium M382]
MSYFRPLVQSGEIRPDTAVTLAGMPHLWFTHVEIMQRNAGSEIVTVEAVPGDVLARLSAPREPIAGLDMGQAQIMGILNVTPDSFSDGGRHNDLTDATAAALQMAQDGASIIDIGGESTRPGADFIEIPDEIERTAPVIGAIRAKSTVQISIDTRKAAVGQAALNVGANLINDVAGFTFDPELGSVAARAGVPVCVMHAQGDPKTMQNDPQYDHVVLDVYDFLQERIAYLESLGVARTQIVTDPGIGFGKTLEHNLSILRNISLFHALGCPILLGASRKRFIGTIGKAPLADDRAPGSIAVGLAALAQGVQILRVHDVGETAQAVRLWQAAR